MDIYVKELRVPEVLESGANVTFILSTGERIDYTVIPWFLYYSGKYERIFTILGITNRVKFVSDIVGYNAAGLFPSVRNSEDLMKVIKALASYNNPKTYTAHKDPIKVLDKVENKKEEKFTLSVKKHKQIKLNFKL